jgi:hypothetical protein
VRISLNESRVDLRRFELDAAMREHAELWDSWKVIEAKAQPVSTTAGVFLAGVFAYASQQTQLSSEAERILLVLLALLLLVSIVQALRSIWVVDVESPHLGLDAKKEVDRILQVTQPPDSLEVRHENLLADTSKRWLETCERIRSKLETKSRLLKRSLQCLALSAIVTLVLVPVTLYCRGSAT